MTQLHPTAPAAPAVRAAATSVAGARSGSGPSPFAELSMIPALTIVAMFLLTPIYTGVTQIKIDPSERSPIDFQAVANGAPLTLATLPEVFERQWRARLGEKDYIKAFLPPSIASSAKNQRDKSSGHDPGPIHLKAKEVKGAAGQLHIPGDTDYRQPPAGPLLESCSHRAAIGPESLGERLVDDYHARGSGRIGIAPT